MSMRRTLLLALSLIVPHAGAFAAGPSVKAPHLGRALTAADIAKWDKSIFPDGRGLPPGEGTASDGRVFYVQKCASCHGAHGEGATAEDLIGEPKPPTVNNPSKTIGAYWPFATTIFDFIARSMPPDAPGSLSASQTYALTAYLLAANDVIADTDEINAKTLPQVKMPNRNGFIWIDADK